MKFLIAYLATAITFLVIDYIWLGYIAKDMFTNTLSHLMADEPNLAIAALFYLFYAGGIVYFCVMPAINGGSWTNALLNGAILGFLAYGTYDATNAATLRDWPIKTSIIDTCFGTCLTAVSAVSGYFATKWYLS